MTIHSPETGDGNSTSATLAPDSGADKGYGIWFVSSLVGLIVGALGLVLGDNTAYRWVRAFALLGFVLLASEFTLSKNHEIALVKRFAGPAALAAAWVVFVSAVADASGLND